MAYPLLKHFPLKFCPFNFKQKQTGERSLNSNDLCSDFLNLFSLFYSDNVGACNHTYRYSSHCEMKVYLDVEKEGDSDLYNDAMGVVEA